MAEMIPESIPSGKPLGERLVFDLLQRLPDDCLVYYEPVIAERYPDFIVISPSLGVLVIEVKGWAAKNIEGADDEVIKLRDGQQIVSYKHPVRQARGYMFDVMNTCRRHPEFPELSRSEGVYKGRYFFPFGHAVFLTRISASDLQDSALNLVLRDSKIVTSDLLDSWRQLGDKQIERELTSCFNLRWPFPKLTERQVDILRAAIHPEIIVGRKPPETKAAPKTPAKPEPGLASIKILDRQQEVYARKIGDGHRVLNGVAGSGKTILLLHRARWLSEQDSTKKILVLCYNRALSAFLKSELMDCGNVRATTFHQWGFSLKAKSNKDLEQFGANVLTSVERLQEKEKYDAILIDEAQDFTPSWFRCAVSALKYSDAGDLIIVADGNQGIYRPKSFRWIDVGVKARGRVIPLRRNYRNTNEIMQFAWLFSAESEIDRGEAIVSIKPVAAVRNGPEPILFKATNLEAENKKIIELVQDLLRGRWESKKLPEPLAPHEIGVIYPRVPGKGGMWPMFFALKAQLEQLCPVVWLNDKKLKGAKDKVTAPGLKIQTIDTSKGLQYRATILMWTDLLPRNLPDSDEEQDRRKLYVGLTRAQDFLAVTYSQESEFTKKLESCWTLTFKL
jgi:hypothetical protein